ncbi:MAG: PHP domain-containing protein [Chloroflexota bacterium]|nr:PHP domain-containing protein [Chloroflexota bacterium]MDE2884668.1 PHP domain-containing protein [Chloroflexota bacterium]
MKIDLHMHSTRSDGRLTPTELVGVLAQRQVSVASLTDHDSTEGLDEAVEAAAAHPGLRIVPGIEISASHPTRSDSDVHLLGYFVDRADAGLQRQLTALREEREERGLRMLERLARLGYSLEWERVRELAAGASIGRPHIARAMVERGYVATYKEAFNGLLNNGGAAFVGRSGVTLEDAAHTIRNAGGAAVLAHPLYVEEYETIVPRLPDMGIVGLEAHYANYDETEQRILFDLAERYGLLPCGGSDYHAMGTENEALPGADGPPREVFEALERLAGVG